MKRVAVIIAVLALCTSGFSQTRESLHSSRHFYAPTGFTVPADSIYLNWVGPLLLDVNFGITDKLTAGIGTPLFTGVYGTASYGGALTSNQLIHGRIGGLMGFPVVGEGFYALPYGVLTYGTPRHEMTLGAGYFHFAPALQEAIDLDFDPSSPALNVGGYNKLNNRLGLVYEFWWLPESQYTVFMPGVRFFTRRNKQYWNIGIIRLWWPYMQETWDPVTGQYTGEYKAIERITLPMFSFASYL